MDEVHPLEKRACAKHRPFSAVKLQLDCSDRASVGTGAALDALLSVDDVLLVALGDDAQGAGIGAGAALQASIGNGVSHGFSSLCLYGGLMSPCCTYHNMFFEKSNGEIKIFCIIFLKDRLTNGKAG